MKVMAINGSPRTNGNTISALKEAGTVLEKHGIEVEHYQLGGKTIRGCLGCYKCMENKNNRCIIDDELNGMMDKFFEADGLLIGSPTYFSDITSETKAFIDRVGFVGRANGGKFYRKVGAAVIAVRRAGGIHAFNSINHFFLINGMIVPGSSYWNLTISRDIGDYDMDEEGVNTMKNLGENMAWLMDKIVK